MKTPFLNQFKTSVVALGLSALLAAGSNAAVTPGGTLADKAIITESGGGETLAPAAAVDGFGTPLVHDFDTPVVVDGSYEITSPTAIALSSGLHLVMYSTRFDTAGSNRCEILTNLTLAGSPIAAGRSQGFTRRLGGADETIMSGGAIIDVAADDDVMTLESLRSDINTPNITTREPNATSVQLLKLDDTWDYLSVERGANQVGAVGVTAVDVTYDTNNSAGTMGTAFSFAATSGDVTLNETGLYLVFANTGIRSNSAAGTGTRTMYQQFLTLGGVEVAGSKTTTYVRGNGNAEDARNGVASLGMIVSATAGQVLNVEVLREASGYDGTIQGDQSALTIVKLPSTAKYIQLTHSLDQNVVNSSATPITFDTEVSPATTNFSHAGNTVTANNAGDYLFFGSLFTESDATNDNNDRVIPFTRWRLNGTDILNRGQATSYNRDGTGNHTSGSWNATLLSLAAGDTIQLLSQNLGTASGAFPNNPQMQGLSISSLILTPHIVTNEAIDPPVTTTQTITTLDLEVADGDTAASGLTYTLTSAPAGGTLNHTVNGAIVLSGTFTQDDIDNDRIEFTAGGSALPGGGFDFDVSDGTSTISGSFVVNVIFPITTLTIAGDGPVTEGVQAGWTITGTPPPNGDAVTVNIVYSGNATDGTDYTGVASVTLPNNTATVDLDVATLADGDFEGIENLTATIDSVTSTFVSPLIGTPASASVTIADGANSAPTGTNLEQVLVGTGNVAIDDIVVTDPDTTYDSTVTTAGTALFQTNGISNVTVFSDGRANDDTSFDVDAAGPALSEAAGFSVEIAFIPQAGDLTGVVDVWEIGGSSNGSSILLIEGVPHLLSKAGGGPGDSPTDDTSVPGAFTDLDWATDNTIVVPLDGATVLTAGLPARLAVVYDIVGNTVKSSVNGSAEASATLLNVDGTDWKGDHTVNTGTGAGSGTGGSSTSGLPLQSTLKNLAGGSGAVSSVRFWNESTGSTTPTAGAADIVTATLTISGWSSAANGTLTATSGNGETFAAGVWSVTGDASVVNAALAAVEFVTGGSTADPTVIAVSLEDGDEDGGGPTTGTIAVTATVPDPIYVDDDFSGSLGDPIADGDLGDAGLQAATFGVNAFANLTDALAAVTPTGTIIVNDGDYSTENITLADDVTLQLTATAGPVQIGDISAGLTNSIDLQSNTLEIGATNLTTGAIAATISGSGNLTKVGTGRATIWAPTTHTGTTTISDGFLRIGQNLALDPSLQSDLGGDGPIVVTAPGRLEFVIALDETINQTGFISGTGSVATFNDGTLVFDGAGANTFSGGFELGDGGVSNSDGTAGNPNGFVVVNHNDHLGTGIVLSRGSQLRAGTTGIVIPNTMEVTSGGLRLGGANNFEISGDITTIDASDRTFGNYGLEGTDLTLSGNLITTAAADLIFEGVNNKDNGNWIVTGDISGPQQVDVNGNFDNGVITFSGTHTNAGTSAFDSGTIVFNATQTGGGAITVAAAATLEGVGSTTSAVTVAGTLSPGTSPGSFATGDLTINGTLEIDADNNTPGTGHDQVVVTGVVTLGGASELVVNAGAGLTPGTLTIIANDDGTDAVSGTFAGLAEGAALDSLALGFDATATYQAGGGDNNDVALAFTSYTIIGQWRVDNYGDPANSGSGENDELGGNNRPNVENFAFGLDKDGNSIAPTDTRFDGFEVVQDSGQFYAQYPRRSDFAAAGITFKEEFSFNMVEDSWEEESPAETPTFVDSVNDGSLTVELVRVELPGTLPTSGRKARTSRLETSIAE